MSAGVKNTLPLEIFGMTTNVTTPVLYALGTVTTAVSFMIIGIALTTITLMNRRRAKAAGRWPGHGESHVRHALANLAGKP